MRKAFLRRLQLATTPQGPQERRQIRCRIGRSPGRPFRLGTSTLHYMFYDVCDSTRNYGFRSVMIIFFMRMLRSRHVTPIGFKGLLEKARHRSSLLRCDEKQKQDDGLMVSATTIYEYKGHRSRKLFACADFGCDIHESFGSAGSIGGSLIDLGGEKSLPLSSGHPSVTSRRSLVVHMFGPYIYTWGYGFTFFFEEIPSQRRSG